MSTLQPLITAAFASYAVNRGVFAERTPVTTAPDAVAQTPNAERLAPVQESREVAEIDTDFGKPRSLSGDVLDLSWAAQRVSDSDTADTGLVDAKVDAAANTETQTQATEANTVDSRAELDELEQAKAELNAQAEAELVARTGTDGANGINSDSEADESDSSIQVGSSGETLADPATATTAQSPTASELTPEEEEQVRELQTRDAEVRTHEMQHVAAGGPYVTGGPTYTYQTGPDGRKYAVGGEVSIDTGSVSGDPEATIRKMQTVAAAALAPAEPSGQDYKVAAAARQAEAKARTELSQQRQEEATAASEPSEDDGRQPFSVNAAQESADDDKVASNTSPSATASTAGNPRLSSQISAYQAQSISGSMTATSGETGPSTRFSAFA